jgi:peptidoglycan/LPS O-acetylase OafA/YrhL
VFGVLIAIHLKWFDYGAGIYYTRTQFRIDSILIGCFLALFLANGGRVPKFIRSFPVSAVWLVVLAWTLIGESISRELYLTGQMVGAAWILFRSITATRFAFLTSAPLRFVGNISYSLYLWQQVFLEVKSPSWGPLQVFPINLAMSFACALGSYFLIERPFLRMKGRRNSQGDQPHSLLNVACANGRSES